MFEVRFTKWNRDTGKVDRTWTDRGFTELHQAIQHIAYSLPATDVDRIWVLKANVIYVEVKPNG